MLFSRRICFRVLAAVAFAALASCVILPVIDSAFGRGANLGTKIERKRRAIEHKKQRENVLTTDIAQYTDRIRDLQGNITRLQNKQVRIEADLERKKAVLDQTQDSLRTERARLERLRARLDKSKRILMARLVELYKAGQPDIVTVVLESKGFAQLLEQAEFIKRISRQDRSIITEVASSKEQAAKATDRLTELEHRQAAVTKAVADRRNEVASVKGELVDKRSQYAQARSRKSGLLSSVRKSRHHDEEDLRAMERSQAKIMGTLRTSSRSSSIVAGPIRSGSGSLIWPVNGSVSSGFGLRWGRLHAGVDIPASTGTPIRAAASGRVVIAGWVGGYGNYTCIQHSGSLSTCYGHQSGFAVSVGSSVAQGQVIGYVGSTGHSTGPHLHFETRISGSPQNPLGYL